jgi:hypothetical protein
VVKSQLFDSLVVWELLRRLTQPWTDTPAYKHGIIDRVGNVVRKPENDAERRDYTTLDKMVFSMRRLIGALPGGKQRLATVFAAMWLLREPKSKAPLTECRALVVEFVRQHPQWYMLTEDAGANAAGNGGVAGLGVGPQGEPGGTKRTRFANNDVFIVKSERFFAAQQGKRKFLAYDKYVGDDETGKEIREYAVSNPDKPVILQDEVTGAMSYLRYGKNNPARKLGFYDF